MPDVVAPALAALLPHRLPRHADARLALYVIRRMGAHGLGDARAAAALIAAFGPAFRRPLVLMRTLMTDIAGGATAPIAIAPCCCGRMTSAEAALVAILARAETAPDAARLLLADLLGTRAVDGVFASVAATAAAFADAGRPVTV